MVSDHPAARQNLIEKAAGPEFWSFDSAPLSTGARVPGSDELTPLIQQSAIDSFSPAWTTGQER